MSWIFTCSISYVFSICRSFPCGLLAKCEGVMTSHLLLPPLQPPRGLVSGWSEHVCPPTCSDVKHYITALYVQVPHPVHPSAHTARSLRCASLAFTWSLPRLQIYRTLPPRRPTPALQWVLIAVPVFSSSNGNQLGAHVHGPSPVNESYPASLPRRKHRVH